jgi:hypothetical protein
MNNQNISASPGGLEAVEARYALRVAARLSESANELPHDVGERLKAARELALQRARAVRRTETASSTHANSTGAQATVTLGGGGPRWWLRWAPALPVAALVCGFVFIGHAHTRAQIAAAAEIDAALLADEVPPAAYGDPGFVEFLKVPHD